MKQHSFTRGFITNCFPVCLHTSAFKIPNCGDWMIKSTLSSTDFSVGILVVMPHHVNQLPGSASLNALQPDNFRDIVMLSWPTVIRGKTTQNVRFT